MVGIDISKAFIGSAQEAETREPLGIAYLDANAATTRIAGRFGGCLLSSRSRSKTETVRTDAGA